MHTTPQIYAITSPNLQMRKQRHKEVTQLGQGHPGSTQQSQNSKLGNLTPIHTVNLYDMILDSHPFLCVPWDPTQQGLKNACLIQWKKESLSNKWCW